MSMRTHIMFVIGLTIDGPVARRLGVSPSVPGLLFILLVKPSFATSEYTNGIRDPAYHVGGFCVAIHTGVVPV